MTKLNKLFDKEDKIFVAGHNGMVGKAICRSLTKRGYQNIITSTRSNLDLTNTDVDDFINENRPEIVVLAAQKLEGYTQIINIPEIHFK